tara:strand:+ start:663 stop:1484 length:822 start_codon:yes stop_codon:yes gene_type:complete
LRAAEGGAGGGGGGGGLMLTQPTREFKVSPDPKDIFFFRTSRMSDTSDARAAAFGAEPREASTSAPERLRQRPGMLITVRFLDGSVQRTHATRTTTVGQLRKDVAREAQMPGGEASLGLCCQGQVLLHDTATLWDALHGSTLAAWDRRHSRTIAEAKQEARDAAEYAQANARKEAARQLWQQARDQWPHVKATLRRLPLKTWVLGSGWVLLLLASRYLQVGSVFLMGSAIVFMLTNLGTRTDGPSAYTVFNRDLRALPGQLQMDDFERELRHQ